jgi:hypothetical protein
VNGEEELELPLAAMVNSSFAGMNKIVIFF